MAIGVVGTAGGTTNFDVIAANQLYVAGTITGSVQNTGTESSASEVLTAIACPGTITGSVLNASTVGVKGTTIGSRIDTTTLNVKGTQTGSLVRATNIETKGTIIGSKMSVGTLSYDVTGDLGVTGTVTGTYFQGSIAGFSTLEGSTVAAAGALSGVGITGSVLTGSGALVRGTVIGSVVNSGTHNVTQSNVTNLDAAVGVTGSVLTGSGALVKGTTIGSVITGSIINTANLIGSTATLGQAGVAGTVTGTKGHFTDLHGSVIVGSGITLGGSAITRAEMLASSGTISHGATPGTYTHGLGVAPSFISIVPIAALQGATGTEGMAPFMPAAADATAVYVQSGTTGSSWVFTLA